jgi:hypothetical protein
MAATAATAGAVSAVSAVSAGSAVSAVSAGSAVSAVSAGSAGPAVLSLSLRRADAERLLRVLRRELGDWPSVQLLGHLCGADGRRAFVELEDWLVRCVGQDALTAAERLEVSIEFYSVGRHTDLAAGLCRRVADVEWAMGLVCPSSRDAFRSRRSYMSTYSSSKLAKFMADNDGSIDVERAYVSERQRCETNERSCRASIPLDEFIRDTLKSRTMDMLRLEASKEAIILDGRRRVDVCDAYRKPRAARPQK